MMNIDFLLPMIAFYYSGKFEKAQIDSFELEKVSSTLLIFRTVR